MADDINKEISIDVEIYVDRQQQGAIIKNSVMPIGIKKSFEILKKFL